ncbi:serine hydrolase domain-containing protein [Rhodotorula paludigena]|uniref:serine hydrolase domain-containing protein n=1 Tax=Rhodotorula paludigena TaxID=86838 RepID=UPI0031771CC9
MLSVAPILDSLVCKADLPRLVFLAASASDDGQLYTGTGGYARPPAAEEPHGESVTASHVFELFSCTKLVTVIALVQLIEQGTVALEDDAAIFMPELGRVKLFRGFNSAGELLLEENQTPITVRMLATHTAGFAYPYHSETGRRTALKLGVDPFPYDAKATLREITDVPLMHPPGQRVTYGTSFDWLGLVVEAATGLDLEAYFQRYIFTPLGITDASFRPPPGQIPLAYLSTAPPVRYAPSSPLTSRPLGGCGLKTSPSSFLRILQALLRGGDGLFCKQESVELLFRAQLRTEVQRESLRDAVIPWVSPWSRKGGEADMDLAIGGALTGGDGRSGGESRRGKGTLSWSGRANDYWVIDRERRVCYLLWTNTLPSAHPQVFELWEKLEMALYDGLQQQ